MTMTLNESHKKGSEGFESAEWKRVREEAQAYTKDLKNGPSREFGEVLP